MREFTDRVHALFDPQQSEHQAYCRLAVLKRTLKSQAIPELVKVLKSLEKAKFSKMIAFLRGPAARRRQVRTNNHVERCNRKLRYWEKMRYKWRRRRTLVRYIVLALDRWWSTAFAPTEPSPSATLKRSTRRKTNSQKTPKTEAL